jgi:acetylornithine deacetylase/succinyl-diaminopimelate desuccinylase-like protein
MLARLLVSMKDNNGHVLVDHFYEGNVPLGAFEKRANADAPDIGATLQKEFWLGSTESSPKRLVELITEPSLNIHGMASGRIGDQASNVIPASATAAIDMRLVKGMDRHVTEARLIDHIRKLGYFVVDSGPNAEIRRTHAMVAKVTVRPGGYNGWCDWLWSSILLPGLDTDRSTTTYIIPHACLAQRTTR